jgi:hypothetical protein
MTVPMSRLIGKPGQVRVGDLMLEIVHKGRHDRPWLRHPDGREFYPAELDGLAAELGVNAADLRMLSAPAARGGSVVNLCSACATAVVAFIRRSHGRHEGGRSAAGGGASSSNRPDRTKTPHASPGDALPASGSMDLTSGGRQGPR